MATPGLMGYHRAIEEKRAVVERKLGRHAALHVVYSKSDIEFMADILRQVKFAVQVVIV